MRSFIQKNPNRSADGGLLREKEYFLYLEDEAPIWIKDHR